MQWPNLIKKLDVERCLRQFQETQDERGECVICGSLTEFVAAMWFTASEKYRIDIFRVCEKCRTLDLKAALADRRDKAFGFEVDRTSAPK